MFRIADRYQIRLWLDEAFKLGATHLIVVVNMFWDDFPVYVMPGEDTREIASRFDGIDRQRIMEVYSLAMDLEAQLDDFRAFNWE